jgi:hypothetical protein
MARYFLQMLKAMVVCSLGLGGGVAMFALIVFIIVKNDQNALENALRMGFGIGQVFAMFALAVFIPLDISVKMYKSKGVHKDIWETEQVRDATMNGSARDVLAACREALLEIPDIKAVREDSENLVVHASAGPSWRSFGEEIEVEINPVAQEQWNVSCHSKPKSKNIVFDWGKNFENVETWKNKLQKSEMFDLTEAH